LSSQPQHSISVDLKFLEKEVKLKKALKIKEPQDYKTGGPTTTPKKATDTLAYNDSEASKPKRQGHATDQVRSWYSSKEEIPKRNRESTL